MYIYMYLKKCIASGSSIVTIDNNLVNGNGNTVITI